MTSISGNSSASALQAQQLLQQLLRQAQASKQNDISSTDSASAVGSAFAAQVASSSGAQAPAAASSTSTDDLAALFKSIDTDGNGSVSKEEFSTAFQKLDASSQSTVLGAQEQAQTTQQQQTAIDNLFADADTNGDGSIDSSELDSLAAKVQPSAIGGKHHHHHDVSKTDDANKLSQVFDSLDTNQDGVVSVDELATAITNNSAKTNADTGLSLADSSSADGGDADAVAKAKGTGDTKLSQDVKNFLTLVSNQLNAAKQQSQLGTSTSVLA